METTINEPTRLYKFYRLLIIPALLWYGWIAYLALTTPEGVTIRYAEWARIFAIFVGIPTTFWVGFAIMRYRPGNIIGPAMIVGAATGTPEVISALTLSAQQAVINDLVLWVGFIPATTIMTSHFPSGSVHLQWIRRFAYTMIALAVVAGIGSTFGSATAYGSEFAYTEPLANPFLLDVLEPISEAIYQTSLVIAGLVTAGWFVMLVARYITTTRQERKQMQWGILGMLLPSVPVFLPLFINVSDSVALTSSVGIVSSSISLPIAIGIAILFYNLWDIDVIIRRTLTYAVVSALLAGTYFLIVTLAQSLLSNFFDQNNTLLIVLSTLAVAVLFNPVRERVQNAVDRLFYRKRYDAQEILDQFSNHLRHAMEPDAIQRQLLQSVTETIQPQSISLWMVERTQGD